MRENTWLYPSGGYLCSICHCARSSGIGSQILSQALSRYAGSSTIVNILGYVNGCNVAAGNDRAQYDLTGYLAAAMSKHGQDERVKDIAEAIRIGEKFGGGALWLAGYFSFYQLEGPWKEWDIKRQIHNKLGKNIVLCSGEANCDWFDYSTPGNIHFGYIAGLARIDHFVAAIAGGALEQKDLKEAAEKAGKPFDILECFRNNSIVACDNPQDQAAVDFGYELSKRYPTGISDYDLMREMQAFGMNRFQKNAHAYDEYWWTEYHELNKYGADYFNN